MERNQMVVDGIAVHGDYLILADNTILAASYFDRAKVKVKAISASLGGKGLWFQYKTFSTKGESFRTVFKPVVMGRDHFIYTTSVNKEVGTRYLITTEDHLYEDVYDFLMTNYKLPLLKNWMPSLVAAFLDGRDVYKESPYSTYKCARAGARIPLHGEYTPLEDIRVYDFACLTEEKLETAVSTLLRTGKIRIAGRLSEPLEFKDFSEYMEKYGNLSAAKLEEQIKPLVPLKGAVDTFAGLKKRMYPQQAAIVNGLVALMESGARYGLDVAEMGCGKTEMGMALVDAAMNKKWLKSHPGKTLKDAYLEEAVHYRAIMMAPGHLIGKWKEEILSEIPAARVEVIDDFKKLVALRKEGKKPVGRRWYLISKDFCKLGSQYSPIPSVVGTSYVVKNYCVDCFENYGEYFYQAGTGKKAHCPKCGGKHFKPTALVGEGRYRGLMCPKCNNLLLSGKKGELEADVLKPSDFASRTGANSVCAVCGQQLWGVDAANVSNIIGAKEHEPRWHKITHYKNYAHKAKTTAFVLKGHEQEYMASVGMADESYTECQRAKGPRKYAPSLYIKKYLKGYFDVCVLDEVHKYENGGTAQSNAASALHSASRFTLGLTGTLSNGNAASFFYLLYMLDPDRMQKRGYAYTDVMKFVSAYGSVETVYAGGKIDDDGVYNASSRGRVIQAPKVCPGISPLLFTDFLLDRCVMLSLEDLSKYLPPLIEQVVPVSLPPEVAGAYRQATGTLVQLARTKEGGRTALSNMLQIGLSYPDKPYGRSPIKSGNFKDLILCRPENFDCYKNERLPKEDQLVSIVTRELSENRNCFIYCSYTGQEESNVMGRLKEVLVQAGIPGNEIYILRAESPAALQRETFFHERAAEGVRVFICNCKLVETGLDFCFTHKGKAYNYPTLIFYQISYELSVMWQASRRAWRLSQTEECRNYYLAYEGTAQMAALELMAEKQVAASAIQGKFSVDGLAAMAKGTDPRIALAQKLSDSDFVSGSGLSKMFDALNNRNGNKSGELDDAEMGMLFSELMGEDFVLKQVESDTSSEQADDLFAMAALLEKVSEKEERQVKNETSSSMDGVDSMDHAQMATDSFKIFTVMHDSSLFEEEKKTQRKKKRKALENQLDLFELFGTCV